MRKTHRHHKFLSEFRTANVRRFRRSLRLTNLLTLLLVIASGALGLQLITPPDDAGPFQPAILQYVVDGDTIYALVDGARTKIRLLGINTPESVAADPARNTPEGKAASDYVTGLLPAGTPIYLEYDEGRTDPYGRALAYVWLSPDADPGSFEDFRTECLNAVILQNTWCETMFFAPNYKYRDWLTELAAQKS